MRELYADFMNEREALGHMLEIKDDRGEVNLQVFLPHHGVFKENSTTIKSFSNRPQKLRAVYTYYVLMVGHTSQPTLKKYTGRSMCDQKTESFNKLFGGCILIRS